MSATLISDWSSLLDAVSRHESPESWWLTQAGSCVVIEFSGQESDTGIAGIAGISALETVSDWVRKLPCPVVALAIDTADHPLLSACDTRTPNREEANLIVRNIERSPLAALTLVQVLRVADLLAPEHALMVESLAYATLQAGPEFRRWREAYAAAPGASGVEIQEENAVECVNGDGGRLSIRLNRPHARNALNVAMRDALVEAFDVVSADPTITEVTVTGAGRCYSVGGDLGEFGSRPDPATAHQIRSLRSPALALLRCAPRVQFQVHGACIGSGIELAAFGGRLAARGDAYFQLPELRLGLIPGGGGCVSLPRRIGRQRTALLALSGRRLNARRALEWGLIDELLD